MLLEKIEAGISLLPVVSDLRRIGFMDAEDLAREIRDDRSGKVYAASAFGNLKEAFAILARTETVSRRVLAQLDEKHGKV